MRVAAAALLLGLMLAAGAARADGPIIIKFSHVAAPQAHKSRAAEHFKELAERYTSGRVKIELYPNSQLYKDKEELEALQLGAVQMLAPSLSKFGPLGVSEFEVFDLPYLFRNYDELARVTEGAIGRELLAKLEAKGITGLAYWNNGFKMLSANQPLIVPDDVLGLKMRIQPSRVIEAQMMALGTLPQVLGVLGDVSGAVDGRGRRHREPAGQPLQSENVRGAEARDADQSRLSRLRGDRQQAVLGRPAAGHPRQPRTGDCRDDAHRQRAGAAGERGSAAKMSAARQDGDP